MKKRYLLLPLFVFLLVSACIGTAVLARPAGFSTGELPEESKKNIAGNISLRVLAEEPRQIMGIRSFDVDGEGNVVIGTKMLTRANICVYDAGGNFKYGFTYREEGSFGVAFNGGCIDIYSVRSDLAITVDPDGNIVDILRIQETPANREYWDENVWADKRTAGDTEYTAKNEKGLFNIFSSSYSKLVSRNPEGVETVLYDANTPQLIIDYAVLVVVLGVIATVAVGIPLEFKRARKRWNERRKNDPNASPVDWELFWEKLRK
ncbi:MAG: hypothetical protein IKI41_02360 [Clostridia bacterium]|nr:hypothetical protein [Clostridia bacterium]